MVAKEPASPEHFEGKTLAGILEEDGGVVLVPEHCSTEPQLKAVIILLDHLSLGDRDAVGLLPHRVVDLKEDLFQQIIRLHDENVHLRRLALVDDLTGLYNSRYFLSQLDAKRGRTQRTGFPFCLLMIDLENFKSLNDRYGHVEGNRFLREVGKVLREQIRPTDIVSRYSGDEFTVIMPATRLFDSRRTAERLKTAIWRLSKPAGLDISASIGISEYTAGSSSGLDELINRADAAMYHAKYTGKNKISLAGGNEKADMWLGEVSSEEKEALFISAEPSNP